ncbi:UNVERIFIED_CONTAM: hypothetical protein Sindi_2263500 [Sesamum indicum]
MKAPAIETKAGDFMIMGFEKCQSQIQKLNGFAEGFDLSQLDPALDDNLEPYLTKLVAPATEDEFVCLLAKID